jgi:hypothetical protein
MTIGGLKVKACSVRDTVSQLQSSLQRALNEINQVLGLASPASYLMFSTGKLIKV